MINKETYNAFKRLATTAIETLEDDAKDDLIEVGTALGLTDAELHEKFPSFFIRGQEEGDEDLTDENTYGGEDDSKDEDNKTDPEE